MRSERGSVTLWMLGLSVLLLLFGGIAIDLWRALDLQREMAAVADSAAIAAAAGIDEEHYRATDEIRLDPQRAVSLGSASIDGQDARLDSHAIDVAGDGLSVSVQVGAGLELGLLGLFVGQTEPLLIRSTATAEPVLVPA